MIGVTIAHQLPGRIRLRIPEKRGDDAFFRQLREVAGSVPGIRQVEVNHRTGSVLVLHDPDVPLLAMSEAVGLRLETDTGTRPIVEQVGGGLQQIDTALRSVAGGQLDLRGVALIGLLGFGLYQLARGEVLAPAATLFWYAFALTQLRTV
jgi:hypothetical protein